MKIGKNKKENKKEIKNIFRILFESANDGIHILDINGNIIDINHRGHTLLGYKKEEMVGKNISEFIPPSYSSYLPEKISKLLNNGYLIFESANICKDQTILPMEVNCRIIDLDGQKRFFSINRDLTLRKEIENMLSKRVEKYRAVIDTSADGFWIIDMNGNLLEVNNVYSRRSGYSHYELSSMHVCDLAYGETFGKSMEHFKKTIQNGHDRFECYHKTKNGDPWPVEMVANYWPIEEGRIFVFIVDITERKKISEHLNLMAKVFQNIREAMLITDSEKRITNINPSFSELTGFDAGDVLGKDLKLLSAAAHPEKLFQELWQSLSKKSSWKGEIQSRRKNGLTYPISLSITSVKNEKNEILNYIASFTDISDRKRKEREIKAEAARNAALSQISRSLAEVTGDYQATLDLIVRQVGVLVGDTCIARLIGKDGQSLDIAAAYNKDPAIVEKLKRMDQEIPMKVGDGIPALVFETSQPVMIPVVDIEKLHATYRTELWPIMHAISKYSLIFAPLRTQKRLIGVLVLGRTSPEKPYTESNKNFVQDLANRAAMAIGSAQLFSEMEQRVKERTEDLNHTNASLRFANRAKDSFLATMSHEIRTPLSGLLGMLELLSLSGLNEEQLVTLQTARDSGKSLLRILNDILDWSKIEEGKMTLSPKPVSHLSLLQEVANTYAHVAKTAGITLLQHADERISLAHMVDPLRISQVLNNFVSNALKFTMKGEIEISDELIERNECCELVRFSVRDTGIGISEKVQKDLFQIYENSEPGTTRMYGETGLGLAISRRLAEFMGGKIELISAPGQGSTFSLVLNMPVTKGKDENYPVYLEKIISTKPNVQDTAAIPKILVVDDNPVNIMLMIRQIEKLGLQADGAEDGKIALALWREEKYTMVITDCHMPHMNGYELAAAIRTMEARLGRQRMPVIACTANALHEENELCQAAGMDEVMVKPINLSKLHSILSLWLPRKKDITPAEKDNSLNAFM